jgi:hypothetical protein
MIAHAGDELGLPSVAGMPDPLGRHTQVRQRCLGIPEAALADLGMAAERVRHPSYGGQTEFVARMGELYPARPPYPSPPTLPRHPSRWRPRPGAAIPTPAIRGGGQTEFVARMGELYGLPVKVSHEVQLTLS